MKSNQKVGKVKSTRFLVLTAIIPVLIIAAVFACIFFFNIGYVNRNVTAMEVGEEKISISEYNYYFISYMNLFVSNHADNLSLYGISLNNGELEIEESWQEFFHNQTKNYIHQLVVMSRLAEKSGITLDAENEALITSYLERLRQSASNKNMSTKKYLNEIYGAGTTEEIVEKEMRNLYLANTYTKQLENKIEITEDDLQAYYNENSEDFMEADVRLFFLKAEYDENSSEDEIKQAIASVKKEAEALLADITDENSFVEVVDQYAGKDSDSDNNDSSTTLYQHLYRNQLGETDSELAEWIFDSSRISGDKAVLRYANGYAIAFLITPAARNENLSVNLRNILVDDSTVEKVSALGDFPGKTPAKLTENIQEAFQKGDQTESSFAELAKRYSADTSTSSDGGMLKGVSEGDLNHSAIDSWAFAEERKTGDITVVQQESVYQILYFCSYGEECWKSQVRYALTQSRLTDEIKTIISGTNITENEYGIKLAIKELKELLK